MKKVHDKNTDEVNKKNNFFYETLTSDGLKALAKQGGLETCCDMQALTPLWSKATSILDVGAGYGRAIDYLLKHAFKGKITAMERCDIFFKYLKQQFSQFNNIHLLCADILDMGNIQEQFDLILMLWSAFADFSPKEQSAVFANLAKLLNKSGHLVIDTMPENITPVLANKQESQVFFTTIETAVLHNYEPNAQEITQYAQAVGFCNIDRIICQTDIGRERWLYIIN